MTHDGKRTKAGPAEIACSGPQEKTAAEFRFQLAIWGYGSLGTASIEALIAEGYDWVPLNWPVWDRDAEFLATTEIWHGDERQPTPWWWALPGVTELKMREEARG